MHTGHTSVTLLIFSYARSSFASLGITQHACVWFMVLPQVCQNCIGDEDPQTVLDVDQTITAARVDQAISSIMDNLVDESSHLLEAPLQPQSHLTVLQHVRC